MSWRKLTSLWENVDGILLTSPHNLRYFTGFCGGEGVALMTAKERWLFVDSRYTLEAEEEACDVTVVEFAGGMRNAKIAECLGSIGTIGTIGYEDEHLSVSGWKSLKAIKQKLQWVGVSKDLEPLRMIKTEQEIQSLRKAEAIGVDAFLAVLPQIKEGVAEVEIAAELEYQMRKRGAEGTSFETIVVSGYKSGMPHGRPDGKKMTAGDFVTMDFGCRYQGYCSDMTRTIVIGKATEEQRRIYQTVKEAQQAGLDALRAGICGKDADFAARTVIEKRGYGAYFGHSLGHGVGLNIHELPNLSPRSETILKPNMVVTCEPGIYLPGLGGVRIEDMVCITETGIENLTNLAKDLLMI